MSVYEQTTTEISTARVTGEDRTLIYRVVGFLEYMNALRYLDPLARHADAEELAAIDEIIGEHPEFTVYTNLAGRFVGPVGGPETDARLGFPWVLALARVETAGILGTFTQTPNPFATVGPTDYEMDAYRDLLADGARMHYISLSQDPGLRRAARGTPGRPMLMYLRRLHLARQFVEAAAGSNMAQLTPQQLADLNQRRKELASLAAMFAETIDAYLAANQGTRQQTGLVAGTVTDCKQYCGVMLRDERRELRQGTGKVFQFGP